MGVAREETEASKGLKAGKNSTVQRTGRSLLWGNLPEATETRNRVTMGCLDVISMLFPYCTPK